MSLKRIAMEGSNSPKRVQFNWLTLGSHARTLLMEICLICSLSEMGALRAVCCQFNEWITEFISDLGFFAQALSGPHSKEFSLSKTSPFGRLHKALFVNIVYDNYTQFECTILRIRSLIESSGIWKKWLIFAKPHICLTGARWDRILDTFALPEDESSDSGFHLSLIELLMLITGVSAATLGFSTKDLSWFRETNKVIRYYTPEITTCSFLASYAEPERDSDDEDIEEYGDLVLHEDDVRTTPEQYDRMQNFTVNCNVWNWNVLVDLCRLFDDFNIPECKASYSFPASFYPLLALVNAHEAEQGGDFFELWTDGDNIDGEELNNYQSGLANLVNVPIPHKLKQIIVVFAVRHRKDIDLRSPTWYSDFKDSILPFQQQLQVLKAEISNWDKKLLDITPFKHCLEKIENGVRRFNLETLGI
jgi:hypothetical protein